MQAYVPGRRLIPIAASLEVTADHLSIRDLLMSPQGQLDVRAIVLGEALDPHGSMLFIASVVLVALADLHRTTLNRLTGVNGLLICCGAS